MTETAEDEPARPHYFARLWRELGRIGGEHDAFIKVIIVERIVKATVLIALGVGLLVAGHNGWLDYWADFAENVIATGILIPFEVYEVFHHATLFKVGALLLNLAVVGYLAYRKRLFFNI